MFSPSCVVTFGLWVCKAATWAPAELVRFGSWLLFHPHIILCPLSLYDLLPPRHRELRGNKQFTSLKFMNGL